MFISGVQLWIHFRLSYNILVLYLICQVSDKRLLNRSGTGKVFLIEFRSDSSRPPGLRFRRAEAWTNGLRSRMFSRSPETGNVLSAVESQGFRIKELRLRSFWNWSSSSGNCLQGLNDASSRNHASAWERTAGRFCCNRHNLKARGCISRSCIRIKQPVKITVIWLCAQLRQQTENGNYSKE